MRLLLIGHGRMGRLVEQLAPEYGFTIAGIVTTASGPRGITDGTFGEADVAVDFTVPEAVPANLPQLVERRINVAIGTTGWQSHESALREMAASAGLGVVAAANFSPGMYLFQCLAGEAARRFAGRQDVGAWIHEAHHDRKKDAPSGTALAIEQVMRATGYNRVIDISATRAGYIPGTHTIGFDGPSETVTLTHTVRDRAVFARGALEAARWVVGKRGWFGVEDVVGSR
jgi:4-hydroxy-tetrahydrodipicolinate reductase